MAENKSSETKTLAAAAMGRRGPRPFAEVEKASDVKTTLFRIFKYLAKQKILLIITFAVVLVGTAASIIAPRLQSQSIDIIAGEKTGSLATSLILMFIAYFIYCVCSFFQDSISAKLSQQVVKNLREDLFTKLIDIPVKYLDRHSHGDVMSRMTNDVENISTTISQTLPVLFSGILMIVGTFVMMLTLCWQLTLITCATIVLTVIITKLMGKKMREYSRARQAVLGELNGNVEEIVGGFRTVVAYSHQETSIEEFNETSDRLTKASIMINSLGGIFGPIMNSIGNLSYVVIAAFGGVFAINGIISIGVISAFVVYSKQFSRPLGQISQVYSQLQSAIAGAERVFNVLDELDEDMSGVELEQADQMTVTFDHVDFSYVEGTKVLKDFSLTVPSGKKVALVGATGSGKTTVVNLLMRFYDIDSGRILINGQDIAGVTRADLRKNIAIVLQDTTLFNTTVRNNLMYGNQEANEVEMIDAASQSRCLGLIESLPEKWDTVLSEGGSNISQGQQQLLAIARAFIADPKILILDEATSNVDTRTEKAIQTAMQQIMKNRTSIVIAHRLSTIIDADIIVVMDSGRIVESGTHEELLALGGKYAELYTTQYSGVET